MVPLCNYIDRVNVCILKKTREFMGGGDMLASIMEVKNVVSIGQLHMTRKITFPPVLLSIKK